MLKAWLKFERSSVSCNLTIFAEKLLKEWKQHLGAKKNWAKNCSSMFTVHFIIVTDISYQTQSKKTYKVNIKLQINSIETNLYVHSIRVFFLPNMGPRGNICFLLVIVDPCNSQGVIITGNRALPVIKFTLFLESSKQLDVLAQKTSFRHFQPL